MGKASNIVIFYEVDSSAAQQTEEQTQMHTNCVWSPVYAMSSPDPTGPYTRPRRTSRVPIGGLGSAP